MSPKASLSYYVYPRERVIEAIKKHGGRAKVDQIYEYVASAKGKKALERHEQNAVRTAIMRLKVAGLIERESPRTYVLTKSV